MGLVLPFSLPPSLWPECLVQKLCVKNESMKLPGAFSRLTKKKEELYKVQHLLP